MIQINKNLPTILLCLAVLSFSFLAIGGDFLHSHVHEHSHEEGEEQECPLFQFLIQALIATVVFIAAIKIKVQYHISKTFEPDLSMVQFSLPALRAPPVV